MDLALFSVIKEVGGLAHDFCELANRQQPMPSDVLLALVNLGIPINGLDTYAKRPLRTVFPPVAPSTQPKPLSILQAGVKQPHPSHIPPYLPDFPDPHAYIRTPVSHHSLELSRHNYFPRFKCTNFFLQPILPYWFIHHPIALKPNNFLQYYWGIKKFYEEGTLWYH